MEPKDENESNDSKESKKSSNSGKFYFNFRPDDEDNELYKLISSFKDSKNYECDMTKESPNSSSDDKSISSDNINGNNVNSISIKENKKYMER